MLWNTFFAILFCIVVYVCVVVIANRNATTVTLISKIQKQQTAEKAKNTLSLVTWNLGYAGLGEESDFVADGGKSYLPPSKEIVKKNIDGIDRQLSEIKADIFMFQEVAVTSPLTYGQNLNKIIARRLKNSSQILSLDIASRLVPPPLRLAHGCAIYTPLNIGKGSVHKLPLENKYFAGIIKKIYHMLIVRLPVEGSDKHWVVINIHLAAFDDDALVRGKQLKAVFKFAQEEYAKGNWVVIGGDWNLEFAKSPLPHKTDKKYLFWLHDFPNEEVPEGWQIAIDSKVPTVRTVHKAYVKNDNFTSIIDGFVVSPNIEVVDVKTIDTEFKYTDHQPVHVTLRQKQ